MQHGTTDHTACAWMARRNTEIFSSLHPCTPEFLLLQDRLSKKKGCHFFSNLQSAVKWIFQSFLRFLNHPSIPHPPKKLEKRSFRHFFGVGEKFLSRKPVQLNPDLKPWNILKYSSWTSMACSKNRPKKNRPGSMSKPLACQFLLKSHWSVQIPPEICK